VTDAKELDGVRPVSSIILPDASSGQVSVVAPDSSAGSIIRQKSRLDASHQLAQVRFDDLVVNATPFAFAVQKTASLQQSKVLGRQVVRDFAVRGDFPHGVPAVQQQLHDSQSDRMSQRFQAFGGFGERLHVTGRFGRGF
jgi:hypothetical protein